MANLFKKMRVGLEFLTDIDMLLIIGKRIRGGMCHATHSYAKANNKCMKNYKKTLNHHTLYIFRWK